MSSTRRSRRGRRSTVVSVVVSVLLFSGVLVAGPAVAGTGTIGDPARDVTGRSGEHVFTQPSADIRRVRGIFRRDGLITVRIRFSDLRPTTSQETVALVSINDEYYYGSVTTGPGHRRGSLEVGWDDGTYRCPRATHRVSYRHDVVSVSIPRRCLRPVGPGDEATSRTPIQVGASAFRGNLLDVSGADGRRGDTWVRLSRPIRRG